MIALLWLLLAILASPFKSKCQLEAENIALRHQVVVLRRQVRGRVRLTNFDRLAGPALPLVSINSEGPCHRLAGDGHSLASGPLSLLLGVGSRVRGRAAADRWRATRSDADRSIEAARRPDPNLWLQKMCANLWLHGAIKDVSI